MHRLRSHSTKLFRAPNSLGTGDSISLFARRHPILYGTSARAFQFQLQLQVPALRRYAREPFRLFESTLHYIIIIIDTARTVRVLALVSTLARCTSSTVSYRLPESPWYFATIIKSKKVKRAGRDVHTHLARTTLQHHNTTNAHHKPSTLAT